MVMSYTLRKIFTSQVPKIFKSNIRKNHNINNKNNLITKDTVLPIYGCGMLYIAGLIALLYYEPSR